MKYIKQDNKEYKEYSFEDNETLFEKTVVKNAKSIFGEKTIYIDIKTLLKSNKKREGTIPDGYLLDFTIESTPRLYLVENEVRNHSIKNHIAPQIMNFFLNYKDSFIKIKEEISGVSLSLGAATHMEGSSMGTVLKIMFLFAIYGKNFFTLPTILITLALATFICMAMSGIPSGGLISEILILSIFGFPTSAYILLTTIAWLIDAPATCLNATGDIPSTMVTAKLLKE